MKTVILFCLSLFFLLLGGHNYAHARAQHNTVASTPTQNIEKPQQTKLINTNQDLPVIKNNTLSEKREDFVSIEDEDDDSVFARKSVLPTKYFITLAYVTTLISPNSYVKNRLPFCKHLSYTSSYKYILQRVLKI